MKKLIAICITITLFSCNGIAQKKSQQSAKVYEVTKTEAEWKAELSSLAFSVLRKARTEPPFSSPLNKNYKAGIYVCAACNTPLFKSEHKFNSGTGWPSFDREIIGNVEYGTDSNLGYSRDEEHCATCGGHLGHVFNDGPRNTTGRRYCINGVALRFVPEG